MAGSGRKPLRRNGSPRIGDQAAGLSGGLPWGPVPPRRPPEPARLRPALERTLRALREQERITEVDAWLVALCRTVSDRADSKREDSRQYMRMAAALNQQLQGQAPPVDDEFTRLVLAATGPPLPG